MTQTKTGQRRAIRLTQYKSSIKSDSNFLILPNATRFVVASEDCKHILLF